MHIYNITMFFDQFQHVPTVLRNHTWFSVVFFRKTSGGSFPPLWAKVRGGSRRQLSRRRDGSIHHGGSAMVMTALVYRENPWKNHGKSIILWAKHGQNHGKFWENLWFMEVYSWGFMEIIRGLYGDYAWTMIDSWMLSKPLLGFVWKLSTPTLHCLISNFPHI